MTKKYTISDLKKDVEKAMKEKKVFIQKVEREVIFNSLNKMIETFNSGNNLKIETWKSDQSNIEVHHFLGESKATYVFGINPTLIKPKTYKKLLAIIKKEIKI